MDWTVWVLPEQRVEMSVAVYHAVRARVPDLRVRGGRGLPKNFPCELSLGKLRATMGSYVCLHTPRGDVGHWFYPDVYDQAWVNQVSSRIADHLLQGR